MNIFYVSDCCGRVMSDDAKDHGICGRCGEHCEVIRDVYAEDEITVENTVRLFGNG